MITQVQLRWNDFDALGHLYNGSYNSLYDLAQQEFITDVLGLVIPTLKNMNERKVTLFPIKASITINYMQEITPDMCVEVLTSVESVGNKSLTLTQQIRQKGSEVVLSNSRSILVCVDMTDKSTVVVPDSWREAIATRF